MARDTINPKQYNIEMTEAKFKETMLAEFKDAYDFGFDELLLRPREALHFCDMIRRKYNALDLPEDIILRAIMRTRKVKSMR